MTTPIELIKKSTTKLGKCITSYDGRCTGPRYGEVYTVPAGYEGYVSGARSHASPSLGLMEPQWHNTLEEAKDRAWSLSDH
jgi:hypothetical protein